LSLTWHFARNVCRSGAKPFSALNSGWDRVAKAPTRPWLLRVWAGWGVLLWHEFRGANGRAIAYLTGMFASYGLALFLIARAYQGT
jgi:hypothetical protein